jgi:hypothetical protein
MANPIPAATAYALMQKYEQDLAAGLNPVRVVTLEKKKDDKKTYQGTKFITNKFNGGEAWFSARDIIIRRGTADPANTNDGRNKFAGTRNRINIRKSDGGDFGLLVASLETAWKQCVADAIADKSITKGNRAIHDIIQTDFNEDYKNNNPGKEFTENMIQMQIDLDWTPFPATYPYKALAGKTKTNILDFRTLRIEKNDKGQDIEVFDPAMVDVNGVKVLVGEANHHLFITNNSIIRRMRVMWPSTSISQAWISAPFTAIRLVIEPGTEGDMEDELADPSMASTHVITANTNTTLVKPVICANNTNANITDTNTNAMDVDGGKVITTPSTDNMLVVEKPVVTAATDDDINAFLGTI